MSADSSRDGPDTVVFDLGGVLVEWDPKLLYRSLLGSDEEVEAFLEEVDFAGWNHRQDAGERTWAEAVSELAAQHPHHEHLAAAYPERFPETLAGPIHGTVDVLDELHAAGVRLLALTNWSAELFPHARERFPFLDRFEAIVVSGEERLAKPDPALYRVLLERHGVDAGRAVFVDDREVNVEVARSEGMVGLLFTDPGTLRAELVRLGLLEPVNRGDGG